MTNQAFLGDICDFLDHKRKPVTEGLRTSGPFPYYGANGQQGWIDNYIFDEPLVLLAEDGGHFGSATKPIAYKIHGKTWVNNHAHVLRPRPECDIDFLTHVLSFFDVSKFVNGSTRPKLTKGNAERIRIPLPPLPRQRHLAKLLDNAERLRRVRRYTLQQCEALLLAEFLDRFDANLFPYVALEDLAADEKNSFVNGPFGSDLLTNELTDSGVPVIYIRDITTGRYERKSNVFVTPQKARELAFCSAKPGDILVTKVGDPPGTAAIYPSYESNGIVTQDVIRIRPNTDKVLPSYLTCLLNSPQVHGETSKIMVQGTRQRFSLGQFKQISVPLPSIELQKEFANFFGAYERLFFVHRESLRQADHLFQTLLHQAFSEKQ